MLRGRNQEFPDLWPFIAQSKNTLSRDGHNNLREPAEELANLISQVLAGYLLENIQEQAGEAFIDPARVSENRLLAKFSLAQQRH